MKHSLACEVWECNEHVWEWEEHLGVVGAQLAVLREAEPAQGCAGAQRHAALLQHLPAAGIINRKCKRVTARHGRRTRVPDDCEKIPLSRDRHRRAFQCEQRSLKACKHIVMRRQQP